MKPHLIADLDNCIANDEHRIELIRWDEEDPMDRYHEYHSMCIHDEPANLKELDGYTVHFFTAQPEIYRNLRVAWLVAHRIRFRTIFFRHRKDYRHSVDVKRQMLWRLKRIKGIEPEHIALAIDDRQSVINMYQDEFNIPSKLVKIHDTCAYYPPGG